jgi:hypothetical protein
MSTSCEAESRKRPKEEIAKASCTCNAAGPEPRAAGRCTSKFPHRHWRHADKAYLSDYSLIDRLNKRILSLRHNPFPVSDLLPLLAVVVVVVVTFLLVPVAFFVLTDRISSCLFEGERGLVSELKRSLIPSYLHLKAKILKTRKRCFLG